MKAIITSTRTGRERQVNVEMRNGEIIATEKGKRVNVLPKEMERLKREFRKQQGFKFLQEI